MFPCRPNRVPAGHRALLRQQSQSQLRRSRAGKIPRYQRLIEFKKKRWDDTGPGQKIRMRGTGANKSPWPPLPHITPFGVRYFFEI